MRMGQGTESSETCADRPTEVSVIRFVSRNRTIEEIAPKKEVYICKQRNCGKIFTNQEEYKTHETLEALKIRFICREPGCGEELSDPGSMWRHYQEWHNNETNVFVCPYTSCSSVHATSELLEEHIESSHRQQPSIPTEPEIICFEGSDNMIEEEVTRVNESVSYDNERSVIKEAADSGVVRKNEYSIKQNDYNIKEENVIVSTKDYPVEQSKLRAALIQENNIGTKFPKNKDLLITKESFFVKYEDRSTMCMSEIDSSQDTIYEVPSPNQEHRIELGNLEKVFRSGLEGESMKIEDSINEAKSNDEEYTPKKQRMSRSKQEPYKCEINGCGKTYKYISHYRHHQDSHKLITNAMNANTAKTTKIKVGKATTISFFICKMPGCGAQLSNVNTLWKHYQETHANVKPPIPAPKCSEIYRCKIVGCEMEFATSMMLYKHFNEVHSKNSLNNTNIKTGNGSGVLVEQTFHDEATTQQINFKTDLKAKHPHDRNIQSSVIKEESGD